MIVSSLCWSPVCDFFNFADCVNNTVLIIPKTITLPKSQLVVARGFLGKLLSSNRKSPIDPKIMRAFVKPTSLFTINEIVTFPDISHVKYLNFGQRGAALVQLMLSPLVLSVTHFNPSLKISSSTQKRIKLPLSNFENFIPSGNQVCINHMSFITHCDPYLFPTNPIKWACLQENVCTARGLVLTTFS